METKDLICVNCPLGCRIEVTLENNVIQKITGNTCPRGENYARQECTRPMRILTSTVRIEHALHKVLPVITDKEIPLDLMEEAMEEIRKVTVHAPIAVDSIIIENLLDTGANLIASRSMIETK